MTLSAFIENDEPAEADNSHAREAGEPNDYSFVGIIPPPQSPPQ